MDHEKPMYTAHTDDPACAKEFGVTSPKIVLFRNFDEKQLNYDGPQKIEKFSEWVQPKLTPIVFEYDEEKNSDIFTEGDTIVIMYRDAEDKDAPFMKTYKEAAKKYKKGKMLFVESDVIEGVDCRIAEIMGVGEEDLPSLRII